MLARALPRRARPGVLSEYGRAHQSEMTRVHGGMRARGSVLVVDRRQVEEAFVDHLEKMIGIDRAHDLEWAGVVAGHEARRLRLEIDVGDLEVERRRGLRLEGAAVIAPGVAFGKRAVEGFGLVLG